MKQLKFTDDDALIVFREDGNTEIYFPKHYALVPEDSPLWKLYVCIKFLDNKELFDNLSKELMIAANKENQDN